MQGPKDRIRVTISLSRELATQIDELVDGVRIRNRSHAIETLVTDSLDLVQVKHAVILAGGQGALKRVPIILRMIQVLHSHGIFDILIAVGYLGEKIRKEVGDGGTKGVRIQYIESELGTGGALLQLRPKLKRTFLVINLDQPMELDLKNLLRFHHDHHPLVTIATRSLRELTGIYVMEPKLFNYIPEGFCMLEESVFDEVARLGKLLSYPVPTDTR
jgi:NDP-sugar pyrophosphorylase family protein